jgi:glycine hydroxymethyltransferase
MILAGGDLGKALNSQIFPGIQGGPLMHVVAAKAVALGEALRPEFAAYQKRVLKNASVLAEELSAAGFSLVSRGTDTHLLLVDLTDNDFTGKDAETALDKAGITVNKNTVPFETRSPFVTSGIRLGSPALTTRGMGEDEMRFVAKRIVEALESRNNETRLAQVRHDVERFALRFPLFAG